VAAWPVASVALGPDASHRLVDAFSYLALGHVFVANMTGNVVFLGFALAGAPGFSMRHRWCPGVVLVRRSRGGKVGSRLENTGVVCSTLRP